MSVPELVGGVLPPGVHPASLEEVRQRYAFNHRRREIFEGLKYVVEEVQSRHQVTDFWVDGSFVTDKVRPRDVDAIFRAPPSYGPSWGLFSFDRRADLKSYLKVDLLPLSAVGGLTRSPILEYFQLDRNDKPKGILKLQI